MPNKRKERARKEIRESLERLTWVKDHLYNDKKIKEEVINAITIIDSFLCDLDDGWVKKGITMFEGYTRKELKTAFDRVAHVDDWKKPIYKRVMKKDLDVTLSAIRYYTATLPIVTSVPGRPDVYVESEGYREGPVGDH